MLQHICRSHRFSPSERHALCVKSEIGSKQQECGELLIALHLLNARGNNVGEAGVI